MSKRVAEYIPAPARKVIYSLLAAAIAAEAIWDVVPDALEGRVLATFTVLGFGLAVGNTPKG